MRDRPLTPNERWLRDELAAGAEADAVEIEVTDLERTRNEEPKFTVRATPIAPLD